MFADCKRVEEIAGAGLTALPSDTLDAPLVLRGAFSEWPAVQAAKESDQAAADYLSSFYNGQPVSVLASHPDNRGRFFYQPNSKAMNFHTSTERLDVVLGGILHERASAEPVAVAVQAISAPDMLAGLEDANPNLLVPTGTNARLWIGNAVTVAPHFDVADNIAVVVAGRRRFVLFPPEQTPNLYPGPIDQTPAGVPISMVPLGAPDFDRFPKYRQALDAALVAELEPGDAIFIPYLWWHGVQSLAPFNVLMNYWWNRDAATASYPFIQLLQLATVMFRAMPAGQRTSWRALFDHYVFETGGDPMQALDPGHRHDLPTIDAPTMAALKRVLREVLD
jgi:hypothetical protein